MRVWILGSSNIDYTYRVRKLPAIGETIQAENYKVTTGGKGANQAIAAAHWGVSVSYIGAFGGDENGEKLLHVLQSRSINTSYVSIIRDEPSGHALIYVDQKGDNFIVIYGGANLHVPNARESEINFKKGDFLIAQLETNLDAIESYFSLAKKKEGTTILNISPYRPIPSDLLQIVDMIVANEKEACALGGISIDDPISAKVCGLEILKQSGGNSIIVTLGAQGAVLITQDFSYHFPGYDVDVVDTQGAGDAFLGSLVASLAKHNTLKHAVLVANWVAAQSVTKNGSTQHSLPDRNVIDQGDLSKYHLLESISID